MPSGRLGAMITVEGLTKAYGGKTVVDHLTFTVKPGVVTGFLGPNGAGKSTTMRMILGLDRPNAGRALVDGVPYGKLDEPMRRVGALLDAKWVHPNRSARGHLRAMAASAGIPVSRVDQVLADVGLTEAAGKRAGQFSLGMSQRLGLAGAMLGDPGVLLFDEPVNGLDPEGIVWVRKYIRRLASEGRTVLVSSHLLTEMSMTADHLVVIGRGRLVADCSVDEFVAQAAQSSVYVRSPQVKELADALGRVGIASEPDAAGGLLAHTQTTDEVGEVAAREGVVLHELTRRTASLEDAFIQLTGGLVEYHGQLGVPSDPQQAGAAPSGGQGQGYGPPQAYAPPQGYGAPGQAPPPGQGYGPPGYGPPQSGAYGPTGYGPSGGGPQYPAGQQPETYYPALGHGGQGPYPPAGRPGQQGQGPQQQDGGRR